MKTCEEVKKYLEESFCDNEKPGEFDTEITEHIASCLSCRALHNELANLNCILKSSEVDMPDGQQYWERYAEKVNNGISEMLHQNSRRIFSFRNIFYPAVVSAAAALLLAAGIHFYPEPNGRNTPSAITREPVHEPKRKLKFSDFMQMSQAYAAGDRIEQAAISAELKQHLPEVYCFSREVINSNEYEYSAKKPVIQLAGALRVAFLKNMLQGLLTDGNICYDAADALIKINGIEILPYWKALLRDENTQKPAAYALFKINQGIAVLEFIKIYDTMSPENRSFTVSMISAAFNAGSGRRVMNQALECGNQNYRRNALQILGEMKDISAIRCFAGLMSDTEIRDLIVLTADGSDRRKIAEELVMLLGSDKLAVKRMALELLKKFGSTEDTAEIIRFADDSRILSDIIAVTGVIGDEKSIRFLISVLQTGRCKKDAISAISGLDSEKAIPALIMALDVSSVQKDAYGILKQKTGEDFGRNAQRWRQWLQKSQGVKNSGIEEGFSKC
ncbi:MAG: hypothetical protein HZA48_12620 [Planctomycetes bacterium]|nr:hypothetical protein [Planctomycetota bacterium]